MKGKMSKEEFVYIGMTLSGLLKGGSYVEPQGFIRQNDLPLSYEAFLSVECQFGVSTDAIFKKYYPLAFKPNSDFVIRNHGVFVIQN
jgi:hypothetical protein